MAPWKPLNESWKYLPTSPGLYRIRMSHEDNWLYLGQTSHLRHRIAMFKGVFREPMPSAAPHTAAPGLYAYRHLFPTCVLEVSVWTLDVPEQLRLALEDVAIALHRQHYGYSPRCQFGRMPLGWRASSGNDARLVAQGKRFRGGPTTISDDSHLPDLAPHRGLAGDPSAST